MEADVVTRILVVDDDPQLAESTKLILQAYGYHAATLYDPVSAVAHINAEHYDLVLLDVSMPGMTGMQMLDALDRDELDTLFIIMTGDTSTDTAIEALRRGAKDYIRKPCKPDELLVRVRNAIDQKRLAEQNRVVQAENQNLQAQLWETRKRETIGTLSGGIAHDFNNILGIILGNTELAKLESPPDGAAQGHLDNVLSACRRARDIINQLLNFSRDADGTWKSVELGTIVTESLQMIRVSVADNIEISKQIPEAAYFVQGDATQIHQIILNLCTNAAHAMEPKGGLLEVRLERVDFEAESAARAPSGAYMRLSVIDTGHGIPADILDRIFDPYFTTNETGGGSGMGLAVVQGIVSNHGGHIRVASEPGLGSRFEVLLPLSEATAASPELPATRSRTGTGERIMLVDDEQMIIDVIGKMLEKLGYRVVGFTSPVAALESFVADPGGVDMVVTDFAMPGLNGLQLAEKLQEVREGVPILLCSGFNEQLDTIALRDSGIERSIKKPVSMKELGAIVRQTLDGAKAERRAHRRFAADSGAFVIVESSLSEPARLLDVSLSGLSFTYDQSSGEPGLIERLSIVSADQGFVVDQIPFETIFDVDVDEPSTGETVRRRGIRFERLTPAQQQKLDAFIGSHTLH